jgi:hypothetical protein
VELLGRDFWNCLGFNPGRPSTARLTGPRTPASYPTTYIRLTRAPYHIAAPSKTIDNAVNDREAVDESWSTRGTVPTKIATDRIAARAEDRPRHFAIVKMRDIAARTIAKMPKTVRAVMLPIVNRAGRPVV